MSERQDHQPRQGREKYFFRASASDFKKIPGSPIAYWVSGKMRDAFVYGTPMHSIATPRAGMITGDNACFVRLSHEVSRKSIGFRISSRDEAQSSGKKWFPYQKGGPFRKYYGNLEYLVDWEKDGQRLRTTKDSKGKIPAHAFNELYIFKHNVNWSAVSSSKFSCRITELGCLFDASGSAAFPNTIKQCYIIASFLNSHISEELIRAINPTINFQAWEIDNLPIISLEPEIENSIYLYTNNARDLSKNDWDAYETSWNFTTLPLLNPNYRQPTLKATYKTLRAHWQTMTQEMQRLEEKNNRIFIEAYGLQDELTPDVPLNEITLTCNPHYRYSGDKTEDELEALLLADTMREFISYAVGCMFGRYSLDMPGLVLANQGDTVEEYYKKISTEKNANHAKEGQEEPFRDFRAFRGSISFPPDEDNVIPILDGDWFNDDIAEQFKQFLKVTFGIEHYEENLRFVESALGKDIRKYFLKDFYADHVKRYKKRPIYWLFSSPKGSFNALIYLHRYRPDTASIVLNGYLREFQTKLEARKNHLQAVSISADVSQGEKTRAIKEIEKIRKMLAELEEYERDVLYPLATAQLAIDLDDGVKANYPKFGAALKKIPGLEAAED